MKKYSVLQKELSDILEKFENSSHSDVDDLLADYEQGIKIINELEKYLKTAELKLKKIKQ